MRKWNEAEFSHCRAAAFGEPRLWREELIQDEVLLLL